MANKKKDITGQKFGMLTAIQYKERRGNVGYWEFLCDCGNTVIKRFGDVVYYSSKHGVANCGCQSKKTRSNSLVKHGMTNHSIHKAWASMKGRCIKTSYENFHNYGGRGIKVCDRWLESFDNFFADMGDTWKEGLSLDRIDNNGNYEPDNCRWATNKEQTRNRRDNKIISTIHGDMLIIEAAELAGVSHSTIRGRVMRGWPIEKLFEPQTRTWTKKVTI